MKIKGRNLQANVETLVLPRPGGEDIVLTFRALADIDEFEKMVPEPEAPKGRNSKGQIVPDFEDESFKQQMKRRSDQQYDYMMLASMSATEGLEWDRVNIKDPNTYHHWEAELKEAGFSMWEIGRIKATVISVNGLNEAKIQAAQASFLAKKVEQAGQ